MNLDSREYFLVETWLQKDPIRWISGALAGAFGGAMYLLFRIVVEGMTGPDLWAPLKFAGLPFLGQDALEYGFQVKQIFVGVLAHEGLCVFLGVVFAHFTRTNKVHYLLGMGFTWAAFSWVFINNLFTPSFRAVFIAKGPESTAFLACLVFGFSLASVAVFDRILRKS